MIGHAHAVGVAQQRSGLSAQQNILEAPILRLDVVDVIGSHVAGVIMLADIEQSVIDAIQLGNVVFLELNKEAIRPEDLVIPVQLAVGVFHILVENSARHFGGHAAGGTNETFGLTGQKIVIDAGIVVKTF